MSLIHFCLLPEASKPLLNKFYKSHQSPMRSAMDSQLWVAKQQEIVGALCLRAISGGHWLTGLFVAPPLRGQGIASDLIQKSVTQVAGPVWLFCHPELSGFYQRAGFEQTTALSQAMAERFARYGRSKPLLAMIRRDGQP
jgi:GNAT superfamily N-acetyltransferase